MKLKTKAFQIIIWKAFLLPYRQLSEHRKVLKKFFSFNIFSETFRREKIFEIELNNFI